jgi:hypothetical protein
LTAPSPRGARRTATFAIAALGVVAGGLLLSRVVLPRAGARWLSHWREAGFPGKAPEGSGPTFRLGPHPSLAWSNVRWDADDSIRVGCRELEIAVRPWRLLGGRLQITRVSATGLRIDAGVGAERWCLAILDGLADTLGVAEDPPTDPGSIRFVLRDVELGRGTLRIDRISGWGRAPRRGEWRSVAQVVLADGRSAMVEAQGAGRAAGAEIEADFSSGPGRQLHLAARHRTGGPWTWKASAQDDGRLLLAMPPLQRLRGSLAFGSEVDLWLERGERRVLDGEAHIRGGRLSIAGGPAWDLDGTVCVGGDTLSLEDLVVARGDTRIAGDLGIPIAVPDGTGWCALDGEISGRSLRIRGKLRRTPGQWSLFAPALLWDGRAAGPLEMTANLGAAGGEGWFRGELIIDGGALSLLGGTGTAELPLRLRLAGVPMESILPMLPVSLPGNWAGALRSDASVWNTAAGWRATGSSTLSGGRVTNVPLLEDLANLAGGSARSTLRIDRARARWLWSEGKIWADSVAIDAKELTIAGSLGYASADSILGLLRVEAKGDGQVGRILRLIGGRGGIDLGIAGDPSRPLLQPLDGSARRAWIRRLADARPGWAPPNEAIGRRRP